MQEEKDKPISDKIKDKFSELSESSTLEEAYEYSRSNLGETATYVALTIGLLLTLVGNFYGPPILGFVAGLYFSKEALSILNQTVSWYESAGMLKVILVGAVLLGLFIKAPMFFVGAAAAVALRRVVLGMEVSSSKPKRNEENNSDQN